MSTGARGTRRPLSAASSREGGRRRGRLGTALCGFVPGFAVAGAFLAAPAAGVAQSADPDPGSGDDGEETRRTMDHEVYETWRTIGQQTLSPDGEWVLYTLELDDGDSELVLHAPGGDEHTVERGGQGTFAAGSSHAVMRIQPELEERRDAQRQELPPHEHPADTLGIVTLEDGDVERITDLGSFQVADDGPWVAIHLDPPDDEENGDDEGEEKPGSPLLLRNLEDGQEHRFEGVTDYQLSNDGSLLLLATAEPLEDNEEDEPRRRVEAVVSQDGEPQVLHEGEGDHENLAVHQHGDAAGFLFRSAEVREDETPNRRATAFELHHWDGNGESQVVAREGDEGIPEDWGVSEHGSISYSAAGDRLFFGTAPRPNAIEEPEHDPLPEEDVEVEVWHYQDDRLMSVQNRQVDQERQRTYQAVLHLEEDRIAQLADEEMPNVSVGQDGDADLAVGNSPLPYLKRADWDSPNYRDAYLVDVGTGQRDQVAEETQGMPSLSPEERWLSWWEPGDTAWYTYDVESGQRVEVSEPIPHALHNEDHDRPMPPGSYGSAGWMEDDQALVIYDRYDAWAVDPSGQGAPRNLTGGEGRDREVRFRLVDLDPDEDALPAEGRTLFSAFDEGTKAAGFYEGRMESDGAPDRLLLTDHRYSPPSPAEDGDRVLFTRQTFQDFPDLYVSNPDFQDVERVSEANPQQDEYLWGDIEMVEWTSGDGLDMEGLLVKPEDFDSDQEYPLIVYFYERNSNDLHMYWTPTAHRSRINPAFYASRGYVVFIPDVIYREGYPGESAYNSIVPGVTSLLERGYIDRDRMALQGHSWAGYQIAFIVTRTQDLFAAAAPGAPVANMISAYGGIRRETGLVRQFQYERTQSRLAGTLWEKPMRYFENSPIFFVDKIDTPLLIMHNDEDGHVPWQQGKELFTSLRRLGKPSWLINYAGEPHWPTTFANRVDWNIRMQQFFDHYLLGEPMPEWMADGIPAVHRDETLGRELVEPRTDDGSGGGGR